MLLPHGQHLFGLFLSTILTQNTMVLDSIYFHVNNCEELIENNQDICRQNISNSFLMFFFRMYMLKSVFKYISNNY